MKLLLPALLLFSFFGSSFAYQLEEVKPIYDEVVTIPDYIWPSYEMGPSVSLTFLPAGPSAEEIAMTAKIDSNDVQLIRLSAILDSVNGVQLKQSAAIEKLSRLNEQSITGINDAKRLSEEKAQTSTWIISLLAISTAFGAFFALRLFVMKRIRQQAQSN